MFYDSDFIMSVFENINRQIPLKRNSVKDVYINISNHKMYYELYECYCDCLFQKKYTNLIMYTFVYDMCTSHKISTGGISPLLNILSIYIVLNMFLKTNCEKICIDDECCIIHKCIYSSHKYLFRYQNFGELFRKMINSWTT